MAALAADLMAGALLLWWLDLAEPLQLSTWWQHWQLLTLTRYRPDAVALRVTGLLGATSFVLLSAVAAVLIWQARSRRTQQAGATPGLLNPIVAATALGLGACSHGGGDVARTLTTRQALFEGDKTVVKVWPLRFNQHAWSILCFDTLYCRAWYARMTLGDDTPTRPSAAYGPGYLEHWSAGVHVDGFPPPAEIKWQTRDGRWRETRIDIDALFKDRRVRHNVPREEVRGARNGRPAVPPSILIEVNGSVIRIYMRAWIGTKHMQKAGNEYSYHRDDLILVKTLNY
ncbi:hypothetical protein RZA67_04125 [Stenotrophomonas sp. C3(2023)]|uniref:hypothetical protein n=1 Tax=Stenotrophomonas sp. C3(2023) TaxID=3080277 RepID=UPI00293C91E6|nr:hypothetical protein [Stenotrophomonas sp. C3(2023)]MDV3467920.1 hypothetical protein [Stenotrophomonas sp. C3(2023)]